MIYQRREECFIRYPNTGKWVETKKGAAEFFNPFLRVWISDETLFGVFDITWISDETLFGVFDITSQSIDNSWRKSKQKFTEIF